MKNPDEDGYGRRRSTEDDVLENFCDRCSSSSSSSSSRRRPRTPEKTENNNVKNMTFRSGTIYTARHPEVRSWSTATTPEFDQFQKFWEEIDRDRLRRHRRRESDREAARVAVDEVRDTAGFENNCVALKELESMSKCSSYYVIKRNPLISLGLFLKPEFSDINDEREEAILFGDSHRPKKPYIHMGRSTQHKVQKREYGTEHIKHSCSSGLLLNGPIEATQSCGYATSSPRKEADRVEKLKSRYMDTILKAQKALGLSADSNYQQGIGLKKTTSRRRQNCKSKATINAPIRGATLE